MNVSKTTKENERPSKGAYRWIHRGIGFAGIFLVLSVVELIYPVVHLTLVPHAIVITAIIAGGCFIIGITTDLPEKPK